MSAGGSVSFTVAVTGTAPLLYQWRFNGVATPDATNATVILGSAKAGDAGEFAAVVRNAAGFAQSAGATLTLNEALAILAQPQGRVIDVGGSATFSVFAVGTGSLSYQWRRDGVNIPGATEASYSVNDAQSADSANYSVAVRDGSGSITSADATLSVLSPPEIVQPPQSQTAVAYNDIFFSVTAGGQGPFTYQWRFNGIPLPGANSSILALPNVQPGQAGAYSVQVFNAVSSTLSADAVLTLLIPAAITQQPQSTNVPPGAAVTFSVTATSSTPIAYQWRFNDVDLPGATGPTLTLTNIQEEIAGNYLVVVTDSIGSIRSEIALLGVIIPLSFIQEPVGQAVVAGGSVTLSGEIRGGPPPFGYEWRKGSIPFASNELSVLKTFYTLTNLQPADAGGYRLVVRNVTRPGGIGSPMIQLTILPDFDQDGLSDALEQALGLSTNNAANASWDLDTDGVSNRDEYIAGTDLADPASYLLIDLLHQSEGATLWFPARSNKTYTVQFTDDLGSGLWQKLDDIVASLTNRLRAVADPGHAPQRTYRVITPRQP